MRFTAFNSQHATVLAIVTVMIFVPGFLTTAPASSGTTHANPQTQNITEFHWDAPKELEGIFAANLRLGADGETFCRYEGRAEGTVVRDRPAVLYWQMGVLDRGRNGAGLHNEQRLRAHAGGLVDSRPVTSATETGPWFSGGLAGSRFGSPARGFVLDITFAGFALEDRSETPDQGPFSIDVSCDRPVELSLFAGRRGVDVQHQAMTDGGHGASIEAPVKAYLYDDARRRFHSGADLVRFQLDIMADSEEGIGEGETGRLFLRHPQGTESWPLPPPEIVEGIDPLRFVGVDGGPGTWTVGLEIRDALRNYDLHGILVELNPVESLDDAILHPARR